MMSFKVYAIIFTGALLVALSFGLERHIKRQVEKGVEAELALKAIEKQNEAIKENALLQEDIKRHNESQNERFEDLNDKYNKALSKNSALQKENLSCERELRQIKQLLGVFYGSK